MSNFKCPSCGASIRFTMIGGEFVQVEMESPPSENFMQTEPTDKQRLDWLEERGSGNVAIVKWHPTCYLEWVLEWEDEGIRGAIDEAMKGKEDE